MEVHKIPFGLRIFLSIIVVGLFFYLWPKMFAKIDNYIWNYKRKLYPRHISRTSNHKINRYIIEGFIAFGDKKTTILSGLLAGLCIFAAVFSFYLLVSVTFLLLRFLSDGLYNYMEMFHNLFDFRDNIPTIIIFAIICMICGLCFAFIRNQTVLVYLEKEHTKMKLLWESETWGVIQGWLLYYIWALWPREEGITFSAAIMQYIWLWITFGLLYGYIIRVLHDFFLWILISGRWSETICHFARRVLLAWDYQGQVEIDVDQESGEVFVYTDTDDSNKARLKDSLNYIQGIKNYSFMSLTEKEKEAR